jgi:hypothetical protein
MQTNNLLFLSQKYMVGLLADGLTSLKAWDPSLQVTKLGIDLLETEALCLDPEDQR